MSVHLIKLSVGIDDFPHLARIQASRLKDAESRGEITGLKHITRNTPKQAAEILGGGSIYWVIKGFIQARQLVTDIRPFKRDDGRPACALVLDPRLVRTEPRSFRAFQGWRYLAAEDAPLDAPTSDGPSDEVPAALMKELKGLGLI